MKTLIVVLLALLISSASHAAISFTDGKWETGFNCSEQTQSGFSCDGLAPAGGWTCSDNTSRPDTITSAAGYPIDSSRGFRHMIGDGQNNNGGGIIAYLPTAQKELWIRAYLRYESGMSWSGTLPYYQKMFYTHTAVGGTDAIIGFQPSGSGKSGVYAQGGTGSLTTGSLGWMTVYPSGIADGSWFVYEAHIKMDTISGGASQNNGIARTWVNGVLSSSQTNVNFSGGNASAANGWTSILIGSNQYQPKGGRCFGMDYDNLVIYNTTPPNTDPGGRAFIGLLDTTPTCSEANLGACTTETACETEGGYWYDGSCHADEEPVTTTCSPLTRQYCTVSDCATTGDGYWYGDECNAEAEPTPVTRTLRQSATGTIRQTDTGTVTQ
jgi:hypothetical protein